jgi:hypothetical protein
MVRHRLGAERVAQREEHRSRMPQGRFDVGLLAFGQLNQELIDVERLGVRLGVDPRLQFGWQLLRDVPGLPARQPLGQRLQRGLQGAVCRLTTYAARRLPDHRDDLLVLHPSSPRNAVSLTAETGVCCMFPRRYISCMRT